MFRKLLCILLVLGFGSASTAQAANYSLSGGGGQFHIGGGLALPIQPAATAAVTGTVFPPLLIPVAPGSKIVLGTTAMTSQQKITVPAGVLTKAAAQTTVGVFTSNPTLYAVATNLAYSWPATAAVFSTGARTGPKTTVFAPAVPGLAGSSTIRYSNPLASKFGGPARFALSQGSPAGVTPGAAVTIFAIAVPPVGNPPCTHTALVPPFPGPGNPACVAGLGHALPAGIGAQGGPVSIFLTTPGGTPAAVSMTTGGTAMLPLGPVPGVGIGAFSAGGGIVFFTLTPAKTMDGFTNMASSAGFPFTTGKITLMAPGAPGAPETFTITGKDSRTPGGAGVIQMVSGALSARTLSGDNANRAWIQLELAPIAPLPAMSPGMCGLTVVLLIMLAVGYGMRPRLRQSL